MQWPTKGQSQPKGRTGWKIGQQRQYFIEAGRCRRSTRLRNESGARPQSQSCQTFLPLGLTKSFGRIEYVRLAELGSRSKSGRL